VINTSRLKDLTSTTSTVQEITSDKVEIKCRIINNLFEGHSIMIKLNSIKTQDDIIASVVDSLYSMLNQHELIGLIKVLDLYFFEVLKFDLDYIKSHPNEIVNVYGFDPNDMSTYENLDQPKYTKIK